MTPPAQPADRHDPLPSLFGLPAHLLRQLSPRWRRIVLGVGIALPNVTIDLDALFV